MLLKIRILKVLNIVYVIFFNGLLLWIEIGNYWFDFLLIYDILFIFYNVKVYDIFYIS